MQPQLFGDSLNILPGNDGEAIFHPQLFSYPESNLYFANLQDEVQWKQEPIKMFGRELMQPRLTAWYGDADKSYSYSGITMIALPWTASLLLIKNKIEAIAGVQFTNALLNLYRDGADSMGWHRDNEKELGINPVIGSVSLGATRTFQLRRYKTKDDCRSLELSNGSFLLMRGSTQHHWEHRVPKKASEAGSRINITFRILA